MHNNYFFLRQLTAALKPELIGYIITSCFSQEKYELLIGLHKQDQEFFIKASLSPHFSALSFPPVFNRARANSINLFPEVIGKQIIDVIQFQNERAFALLFEPGEALVFKLFGNRANIIYFQEDIPVTLFRKKFTPDLALKLSKMDREIQVTQDQFLAGNASLSKLYPTFGDLPAKYLEANRYNTLAPVEQWQRLQEVLALLQNPPAYYITRIENRIRLSLLSLGDIISTLTDPLEANQEFVRTYLAITSFEKTYAEAADYLTKKIMGSFSYLNDLEYKILELEYDTTLSQTADLIMANLNQIPAKAPEVEVYNFYTNSQITIKLSTKESPQKYAERLYKKNKNRRIELTYLQDRYQTKKTEMARLEALLEKLKPIQTNKELKAFLKENPVLNKKDKLEHESLFREFETEGFKILVGKSAQNNDLLTQKYTFKEDLWLHAKDVSGSHVVIKYQSGKIFTKNLIEKAAQLAALYSKRKNDSLCPVLYTPKKYVRKPKGAAPGAVVAEREKVILVRPENPFSQYPGQET